jgi:plastocyanin domain-containing protein
MGAVPPILDRMIRILTASLVIALSSAAFADTTSSKAASKISIEVNKRGFNPDNISVPAKKPVTLVFTRTTDATCTKTVVVTVDDGKKLEKPLPLNTPVEVTVTFPKAGKLSYTCSMDMVKGTIIVQ